MHACVYVGHWCRFFMNIVREVVACYQTIHGVIGSDMGQLSHLIHRCVMCAVGRRCSVLGFC